MCRILPGALSGRKPPLMAEVGQSIPHESMIGIVRSMEAKELRGRPGSKSGRVPAVQFIKTHPVTLVSPVRWA